MFSFTFGDVGSGKSLAQVDTTLYLLKRSVKIQKKYKLPMREVWCNFALNADIHVKYKDRLKYWEDPMEMIFEDYPKNTKIRRNFDVMWDEIAVELPSDKWKETNPEIRRFFAQHRKRGIQIFANTQDYKMLDIHARRMVTEVYQTHKALGSRDPSATLPPIKFPWGLILIWELDKSFIREDDMNRKHVTILPHFLLITKKLINAYDTTSDVAKADRPPLNHIIRKCHTCGMVKVSHE